jgi:hypothetical protein
LATVRKSVGARVYLGDMTTSNSRNTNTESSDPRDIFDDPISYLARYGIVAEVIRDTSLPAAA